MNLGKRFYCTIPEVNIWARGVITGILIDRSAKKNLKESFWSKSEGDKKTPIH